MVLIVLAPTLIEEFSNFSIEELSTLLIPGIESVDESFIPDYTLKVVSSWVLELIKTVEFLFIFTGEDKIMSTLLLFF